MMVKNVLKEKNNCSKCGIFTDLCKANKYKDTQYYRSWCYQCEKDRKDIWRAQNKDQHNLRNKAWAEKNKAKISSKNKKYNLENKEKVSEFGRIWKSKNKDKVNLYTQIRRKRIRLATPKLTEFDELYIIELYHLAQLRNLEVDHIIPLKHKLVCGLHVPENLQLLTASENYRKSNKWTSQD